VYISQGSEKLTDFSLIKFIRRLSGGMFSVEPHGQARGTT